MFPLFRFFAASAILSLLGLSGALGQTSIMPIAPSWAPAEILTWNPLTDPAAPYNVSKVPLAARFAPPKATENAALNAAFNVNANARTKEGRLQALISFNSTKQGPQGWRTTRFYSPTVWQYIDVLGHWGGSGGVISVPMAHVTDAAHRNGVPVLGLVFLAPKVYGGTDARVNDFLTKLGNGSFPVADKMIAAARYFKFDGWFINMETEGGNTARATAMQQFLKYYQAQAPELRLSWYDSMISNGSISWQKQLNSNNQMFFEASGRVSDDIFLDFYWGSTSNLANSRAKAISLGRDPYDIYSGIDTEGSGDNGKLTFGGNPLIDWAQLFPAGQPHVTSLGIYRPEWTFNYSSSPSSALTREIRYWCGQNSDPSNTSIPSGSTNPNWPGIANYIPANSPLTTLPFVTNFSLGQGDRFMVDGTSRLTAPWTNLSLQDILPTWKWIVTSAGTKLSPSFDFATAYYGGTSLKVAGTLTAGQPNEIKLYQASLPVAADTSLRLTYKPGAVNAAQIQVGYAFEDAPATMLYSTTALSNTTAWSTLTFPMGAHAGKKIALITLRFSSTSTISSYQANIGRLQISNGTAIAPDAPTALLIESTGRNPDEAFSTQIRMKWTASTAPVLHYNIYYRRDLTAATNNQRTWLGATPNNLFCAPDVRRIGAENEGYLQVEAIGPDFAVSPALSLVQPFALQTLPSLLNPIIPSYPVPSPITVLSSGTVANATLAFDNNLTNFTEPGGASDAWVGLDLGAGKTRKITAIRFTPRSGQTNRMVNGIFQGTNTAGFTTAADIVELAKVGSTPPESVETTLLVSNPTAFRYLRYLSPGDGYCNVAEIKFYGIPTPAAPTGLTAATRDGTATLTWSASSTATGYQVKRATTPGGSYLTLNANLNALTFTDTSLVPGTTYYYVIAALNESGPGPNSTQVTAVDAYARWLTLAGQTPGTANTGFDQDHNANGIPNGVEYMLPDGLQLLPTPGGSGLTAVIRQDPNVTPLLQTSDNLTTWSSVTLTESPDQTNVPPGFRRVQGPAPVKPFHRLKFTR